MRSWLGFLNSFSPSLFLRSPLTQLTSLSTVRVRLSQLMRKKPPRTISNETLFIDLEGKSVHGAIGPYAIDEISDKLIKFSVGTRDQGAYSEGFFDRYSGDVQATVYGNITVSGGYHLTCKPPEPLF